MSLVAVHTNTYLGVLAYWGEERKEVQGHMVGLLKMMIRQQHVRGTRWFGDGFLVLPTVPLLSALNVYIQNPSTLALPLPHTCNTMD